MCPENTIGCSQFNVYAVLHCLFTSVVQEECLLLQIEYYDGQFDDARYALALAQTAALHGATVLNHATATALLKDADGKVIGAKVKDNETGAVTNVHARVVVNATGPFTDGIRQMGDSKAEGIITPSAGSFSFTLWMPF